MLGISKRFGLEREFAGRDKLLYFDAPRPVEISPPDAIYESPGEALSEDLSPKEPPAPVAPFVSTRPEYITTARPAARIITGPKFREFMEKKGQVSAPSKNFLDIFFDWLNKILSGK